MINLRFFQFYLFIINYLLISLQFHFCDIFVSCKAFRIDSWFAWFLPLSRGICLDSSQIVEHWPLRLACIPQWAPNNSEYFIRGLAWSFACIFRLEGEPAEERNLFFFFLPHRLNQQEWLQLMAFVLFSSPLHPISEFPWNASFFSKYHSLRRTFGMIHGREGKWTKWTLTLVAYSILRTETKRNEKGVV